MIDVEEELKSPIMLYEHIKNEESWFIVVNGNYAYRYILSSKNIDNK
jgi:septal ring-binding cell division protein DamX